MLPKVAMMETHVLLIPVTLPPVVKLSPVPATIKMLALMILAALLLVVYFLQLIAMTMMPALMILVTSPLDVSIPLFHVMMARLAQSTLVINKSVALTKTRTAALVILVSLAHVLLLLDCVSTHPSQTVLSAILQPSKYVIQTTIITASPRNAILAMVIVSLILQSAAMMALHVPMTRATLLMEAVSSYLMFVMTRILVPMTLATKSMVANTLPKYAMITMFAPMIPAKMECARLLPSLVMMA